MAQAASAQSGAPQSSKKADPVADPDGAERPVPGRTSGRQPRDRAGGKQPPPDLQPRRIGPIVEQQSALDGTIDLGEPRGEYVIVLAGAPTENATPSDDQIRAALREAINAGASKKDAVAAVARSMNLPKNQVYALAIPERSV